ncbi:type III secretion protein [Castellaniella sp.]|uniref:type III secretion protein n=1 Tax=Castellaniella sp. TaxID=1955812 RepID=UPI002AFF3D29|nr:type III secretion protein [Castellaniella sp.]
MNVFSELLAIKRFREEQAELAVARQRQAYAQAEELRDDAVTQLVQFQQWAQDQEQAMYQDLCSRLVRVGEIEDVMQGVADLRQGEQDREGRVTEAAEQVSHEADILTQRRETHREASRMVEKFIELARIHAAEQMHELERKEDQEMEEAASVTRDHDDWRHHDEYEPS